MPDPLDKKPKKRKKKKKKSQQSSGPYMTSETHKALYDSALAAREDRSFLDPYSWADSYEYTGSLRPGRLSEPYSFPNSIAKPDYAVHDMGRSSSEEGARGEAVHEHSKSEISKIRKACRIGREVLDVASRFLKAGVTGDEVDLVVRQACVDRDVYPSPFNYYKFPKSVCVSPNEVICHGIPDDRPLEDGDVVNLDVSVYTKDGVHADLNETFFIGEVDERSKFLVQKAFESLQAACDIIRPGTLYRELGPAIEEVVRPHGMSPVRRYSGHGVGLHFHCAPTVPHYAGNKAKAIMKPGHIFTVEPMINDSPKGSDGIWPDNWTAVTVDGARSAQFEHTFLVTETGCEILTARPKTSGNKMVWNDEMVEWLSR